MQTFKGKYVGFAPTGPKGPGLGEFEIVIDDRLIKTRMATGRNIVKESMFIAPFRQMTDEELRLSLGSVEAGDPKNFVGFRHSTGFPAFFFHVDPDGGYVSLLMRTGLEEQGEGPTALICEAMVERGKLEVLLSAIEGAHFKGAVPRLANYGRPGNAAPPD